MFGREALGVHHVEFFQAKEDEGWKFKRWALGIAFAVWVWRLSGLSFSALGMRALFCFRAFCGYLILDNWILEPDDRILRMGSRIVWFPVWVISF